VIDVGETDIIACVIGDQLFSDVDTLSELRKYRFDACVSLSGEDKVVDRLIEEANYFTQSSRPDILKKVTELLSRFTIDGIVWGVGRGSSCASLVFYIMGVHDVNPLKYTLPFSELTKEQSNDY
jgi:DNA polymerase III alpha subunit